MTEPIISGAGAVRLLTGEERRRSQRVIIRIPVSLDFIVAGVKVAVPATTASVNDHGAMVTCGRTLATGNMLELTNQRTLERQICRVVRTPVESPDGFLIPLEFTTSAPSFWRISFPPSNWKSPED